MKRLIPMLMGATLLLFCTIQAAITVNPDAGTSVVLSGQGTGASSLIVCWGSTFDCVTNTVSTDPLSYTPLVPLSNYTFTLGSSSSSFVTPPLLPTNVVVTFPRLASVLQISWVAPSFSGVFNSQARSQGNLVGCSGCSVSYRVCYTLLTLTAAFEQIEVSTYCINTTSLSTSISIRPAHNFHLDLYTVGTTTTGEYLSSRVRVLDGSRATTGPNNDIIPITAPTYPQYLFMNRTINRFSFTFSDKVIGDAILNTLCTVSMGGSLSSFNVDYLYGPNTVTVDNSRLPMMKSSQRYDLRAYHSLLFLNSVTERTNSTFVYTKPDVASNIRPSSVIPFTFTSVAIDFQHPLNRGNGHLFYTITYLDQNNQVVYTTVDNVNALPGATVVLNSNLRPNQRVEASITTYNRDYQNDPSVSLSYSIATLPQVDIFDLSSITFDSVLFNWNYASNKVIPKDTLSDDLHFVVCVQSMNGVSA